VIIKAGQKLAGSATLWLSDYWALIKPEVTFLIVIATPHRILSGFFGPNGSLCAAAARGGMEKHALGTIPATRQSGARIAKELAIHNRSGHY
jgi:hypothetical protein